MRLLTPIIVFGALLLFATHGSAQRQPERPAGFADAFAQAQAASAGRDWIAVRDALVAAESFAPSHPLVLYHLARAEALTGSADRAMRRLHQLVGAGGTERDLMSDSAFTILKDRPQFRSVVRSLHSAAAPIVRSDTSFVLADVDLIPEGIEYDSSADAFLVGSLHRGQILSVGRDGTVSVFSENAAGATDGRRGQVMGLRIDRSRRILWAATLTIDTAAPAFRRGPGGYADLRAFDLGTGRLIAAYPAPDSTLPHLLNDIAVAPNGDVYVTDSEGGAVHRLPRDGSALERVYGEPHRFFYPNGIAIDPGRGRLFIAHGEGISSFLLEDGPLRSPTLISSNGVPMSGVDGMYICGSTLVGIQSLLDGHRVVQFTLDRAGLMLTNAVTLEQKHPLHRVATTGVIVGDHMYYIASSQLDRLAPDGAVRAAEGAAVPSVVLRIPLAGACAS